MVASSAGTGLALWCYTGCGTCRKALAWLDEHQLSYTQHAIRDTPPSADLIADMLLRYGGKRSSILNISSADYRLRKDELAELDDAALARLLSNNGNLLKRPFVVCDGAAWGSGFRLDMWQELLS